VVSDLPSILPSPQEIIARHGIQERVAVRQGNYFHDDFAEGYDLVLRSNILQTEGVKTYQMLRTRC
jgi:hypothetical protein